MPGVGIGIGLSRRSSASALAQVQALASHHWRASEGVTLGTGSAVDTWTDVLSGDDWYDLAGNPPSAVTDTETSATCIRSDGVNDNLRLDAATLVGGTADRSWAFVRRTAAFSGGIDYFLRSHNSAAESLESVGTAQGEAYGVGMHMPTDGAGAIGTRVSHSRELVSEVYTKTGLTWRYYRDGVLMGSRVLTVHGNPAAAFQLFSNNGSNAAGCDLFELAYFPGLALDALQVALWHQFAASEYSSDLFKADVRRTGDLMMFGDSFISATVVDNGRGVSRNTLAWKEAVAGRMPGVALVGTQTATNTHNHEGVGGNTLDQMDARIAAAVDTNTPDVLVLYGGLNDMAGGESGADALLDLESVLATAFAAQPGVSYRVVDLAPHSNGTINARIAAFNAGLDAAIANIRTDNSGIDVERITAGSTLTVADHLDGTDHPNEAGARILANLTVDAVAPLFSVSP